MYINGGALLAWYFYIQKQVYTKRGIIFVPRTCSLCAHLLRTFSGAVGAKSVLNSKW